MESGLNLPFIYHLSYTLVDPPAKGWVIAIGKQARISLSKAFISGQVSLGHNLRPWITRTMTMMMASTSRM